MSTTFKEKKLFSILASLFLITVVWDVWLWFMPAKDTNWNFAFNLVYATLYFFGAYVCFKGAKSLKHIETNRLARAARLWGFALLLWGAGLLVWTYYNLFLKIEVPYPSLADIFFIAFYLPLGLGMIQLKSFNPDKKRLFSLTNLPIVVFVTAVVLVALNRPDLSTELPLLERLLNLSYSLGDALLLSIAFADWPTIIRDFKPSYNLLILGLIAAAAGDILFTYRTAHDTYWNGGISDVFYALFPAIFTYGVIKIFSDKARQKA